MLSQKNFFTIVTQWGKYEYQQLPMDLCNSPEIFHEKMSELFVGLDTVRVYIDALLHVTTGSWTEHLTVLKEMITRLQKDELKVNASKSCFGAHKTDYLGHHVTCDRFMPIPKKVKAIQSLAVPKNSQTIVSFHRHDQLLSWDVAKALWASCPINCLNLQKFKCDWKEEHQNCFDAIKCVIGREVLFAYPDFNAPFEIHTGASKLQIGAVVSQKGEPISFYSRKRDSAQQKLYHNW